MNFKYLVCLISLLVSGLEGMERRRLELGSDGKCVDPEFYNLSQKDQDYLMKFMIQYGQEKLCLKQRIEELTKEIEKKEKQKKDLELAKQVNN